MTGLLGSASNQRVQRRAVIMGPKLKLGCDLVQAGEHGRSGKRLCPEYRLRVSKWTVGQRRNKPVQDVCCATQSCSHPFGDISIACQPDRSKRDDPIYSLQSRDGAAQRNPDLLGQIICFVRERQVLRAFQEFTQQVDPCPTMPSLRMYHELGAERRSNLS